MKTIAQLRGTDDEHLALRRLAGGNISEYLRRLIEADARERGLWWPDQTHDTRSTHGFKSGKS
jgi:hypothetical protein